MHGRWSTTDADYSKANIQLCMHGRWSIYTTDADYSKGNIQLCMHGRWSIYTTDADYFKGNIHLCMQWSVGHPIMKCIGYMHGIFTQSLSARDVTE